MINKKVLVIGSGPIIIGQACEFDYSGVQACKVFNSYGYDVVLLNNNPATIMTDYKNNYKTYLEPINIFVLEKIIKKENPDFIFPSVGGQTSLNLLLDYYNNVNKKINILGPSIEAIKNSESRKKFSLIMKKNKLPIAKAYISRSLKESLEIRKKMIKKTGDSKISIRPSYTLGGLGGGISEDKRSFIYICKKGILMSKNKEILIEESLYGYKEFELEILIDKNNNFLVVCSIENIDPIGIHTGDSICVCPIQTLTDKEFQNIRNMSIKIVKKLKLNSCGANIQFAINRFNGDVKIIEVNPRLSRSSALASKATGYPIAKIATKLSLGFTLDMIKNDVVGYLPAFFEPSIDYIVTKIPKFSNYKFGINRDILGNQMKSIGESMSIGENFESSLQKSLISNDDNDLSFKNEVFEKKNLYKKIFFPNNERIYNLYESIKIGKKLSKINKLSKLDLFFLKKIQNISFLENYLKVNSKIIFSKKKYFLKFKKYGFSDLSFSKITRIKHERIINYRIKNHFLPVYKKIDNCSCEFNTDVNYYYSTYSGYCELDKKTFKNIIIIGSGPNKIGQGIEFDYCCVHASEFLKKNKIISLILNSNPETVSTDYDVSDKLFFTPLNFEEIFNIYIKEKSFGIILQFCGQLNIDLINLLDKYNLKILGTSLKNIKLSENRNFFNLFLKKNKINQPKSVLIKNKNVFFKKIKKIGLPIIIRPSYILGGKNIKILKYKKDILNYYYNNLDKMKLNTPILIEKFLYDYKEFDVDCICDGKKFIILPIIQQIDPTGIHSGDSSSFVPADLNKNRLVNLIKICSFLLKKFKIFGFVNIQLAYNNHLNKFFIIELNSRASRTIPFLMKILGKNIIYRAMNFIVNNYKIDSIRIIMVKKKFFFIKEPIFSFIKFKNSDTLLGPEMKSTGEIISYSKSIYESFLKSKLFFDFNIKKINKIFLISKKINNCIKKLINKFEKKKIFIIYKNKNIKNCFLIKEKVILKKIDNKSIVFLNNDYSNSNIGRKIRFLSKNINLNIYTNKESFKLILKGLLKIKKFSIFSVDEIYKCDK